MQRKWWKNLKESIGRTRKKSEDKKIKKIRD